MRPAHIPNHHAPQNPTLLRAAGPTAPAGWFCGVLSRGPGRDRLLEAVAAFEDALGGATHILEDYGQYQALVCNGINFGANNVGGFAAEDTAARRSAALAQGGQVGDGQGCAWSEDNDAGTGCNLGYFYGWEDDFICGSLGGTAGESCDVRQC